VKYCQTSKSNLLLILSNIYYFGIADQVIGNTIETTSKSVKFSKKIATHTSLSNENCLSIGVEHKIFACDLKLDVWTCWSSTYKMIKRFLKTVDVCSSNHFNMTFTDHFPEGSPALAFLNGGAVNS
jgi:hypothetical protein